MEENSGKTHKKPIKEPLGTRLNDRGGRLNTGGVYPGAGRPKKIPDLEQILADVLGEEKDGMTRMEAIIRHLCVASAKGNTQAAKVLLDRAYGSPKQQIEHSGTEGKSLYPDVVTFRVVGNVDDSEKK